jgi:hypothetical protein
MHPISLGAFLYIPTKGRPEPSSAGDSARRTQLGPTGSGGAIWRSGCKTWKDSEVPILRTAY